MLSLSKGCCASPAIISGSRVNRKKGKRIKLLLIVTGEYRASEGISAFEDRLSTLVS